MRISLPSDDDGEGRRPRRSFALEDCVASTGSSFCVRRTPRGWRPCRQLDLGGGAWRSSRRRRQRPLWRRVLTQRQNRTTANRPALEETFLSAEDGVCSPKLLDAPPLKRAQCGCGVRTVASSVAVGCGSWNPHGSGCGVRTAQLGSRGGLAFWILRRVGVSAVSVSREYRQGGQGGRPIDLEFRGSAGIGRWPRCLFVCSLCKSNAWKAWSEVLKLEDFWRPLIGRSLAAALAAACDAVVFVALSAVAAAFAALLCSRTPEATGSGGNPQIPHFSLALRFDRS